MGVIPVIKSQTIGDVKQHIDKKLRRRMMIYFIMSLAILGFVIYEIAIGSVIAWMALSVMVVGFGGGLLTHRIFLIYRHEDEKKVLSRVDRLGGIILVLYIAFSIFRKQIVEQFFHGPAVIAITMSLAVGLMIGRVFGMRRKILKLLKEQDILE